MKKLFTLLTMLLVGIGSMWGQTQNLTVLNNDPCLGALTDNNQQYLYKSSPITGSTGNTALTIRLTFKSTNDQSKEKSYGYPFVHFAEFYLYDKDGNSVDLTKYSATSIFSSNATSTDEGSINCLNDGITSGASDKYDWYWHSAWRNGPNAYHYLEINAAAIDADLSTFQIGYITRNTNCVPSNIEVTTTVYTPSEIINEVNANADYIAASDKQMNVVGLKPYSVTSALKEAVTAQTPDAKNILIAFEAFKAANKITLVQGNVYRFVSASTAKPGYVVSANSENKLIWEAEDEKDYNQLWKLTWKGSDSYGTILNVGTNLYPQGKGSGGGQFSLGETARNTYISHLGSGQYNIKPQNNGSMHVSGWTDSAKTSGDVISYNNTTIGSPSAWYIYEVEVYTINITGGGDEGRIVINGTEYANGAKFYKVNWDDFTPSAKIISYYHAGDISISENTISLDYTEITVPDGYNGFIAGKTNINEDDWKTQGNWKLSQDWVNSPGIKNNNGSGMWNPIYLQDITEGTVPALEGWNFRMMANHSTYTIESVGKIQGGVDAYITLKNNSVVTMNFGNGHTFPLTVNLEEGNNNILNFHMSNGYKHSNCAEPKCTGQIIVNYGSVSKNTGREFNASGSGAINNLVLNATLTEPTANNTIETITLATFDNVSCNTLTTNILDNEEWTKATSLEDLKAQTSDGKYYYVEESSSTGVILYTYKLYVPVEVNSGAITVAAEITSGVVSLINTAISENKATSVDLTGSSTTEVTGLEIPDNCLVIVNDGTTVNIENNVVVKEGESYSCENLVLTDKVPFKAPVGFTAESITHERTTSSTSAVWGTACLPYPVQSVSGEGDGIRYYQLSESNSKDGVMSFTLITDEIPANTPVVFIKSSGADFNFNATNKSVAITPANPEASEVQGMTLVGTLTGSDNVATDDSKDYYYISGNKFWRATGTLKVSPFRAYFTASKGEARNFTLQVVDDGATTRIDSVDGFDVSDEQVYSLDGKMVNSVKKGGIYIIGGNKVIIK